MFTTESGPESVTRNDLINSVVNFCTNPPPDAAVQLKEFPPDDIKQTLNNVLIRSEELDKYFQLYPKIPTAIQKCANIAVGGLLLMKKSIPPEYHAALYNCFKSKSRKSLDDFAQKLPGEVNNLYVSHDFALGRALHESSVLAASPEWLKKISEHNKRRIFGPFGLMYETLFNKSPNPSLPDFVHIGNQIMDTVFPKDHFKRPLIQTAAPIQFAKPV